MLNTLSPSLPFCFSSLIISFISPTSFCLTIFIYITICIFIYITCFFPISLPQPTFLYTSLYISVSTSSFIHSFIQQTFNKHLPCARHLISLPFSLFPHLSPYLSASPPHLSPRFPCRLPIFLFPTIPISVCHVIHLLSYLFIVSSPHVAVS